MNEEQKANLLKHADFLDNVVNVKATNGIEMAIYYSASDPSDREELGEYEWINNVASHALEPWIEEDLLVIAEPLPEDGPCGFCACAIGWAAKSDLPKPASDEGWDEYSQRIFGIDNWHDSQGAYCFSADLNITDASVIADRIRKVVAAYPEKLEIEPEFLRQ